MFVHDDNSILTQLLGIARGGKLLRYHVYFQPFTRYPEKFRVFDFPIILLVCCVFT